MEKFYDFLAVGVVVCLFLFLVLCAFSPHKSGAQEILPLPCPPITSWTFKAPLIEFKTLCDNVEYTDKAIIVPTACPFKVSVEGSEDNPWVAIPCEMTIKYFVDKGVS